MGTYNYQKLLSAEMEKGFSCKSQQTSSSWEFSFGQTPKKHKLLTRQENSAARQQHEGAEGCQMCPNIIILSLIQGKKNGM